MRATTPIFVIILFLFLGLSLTAQQPSYTYKKGDYSGVGKWYMGREIAHVMGYQGMSWLERSQREEEENSALLLKNMRIRPEDDIADIGAGSGYHVFQMAEMAIDGTIYAVDIQEEMLLAMKKKIATKGVSNVKLVKGDEKTVNLEDNSVDKVLIVDVYHEMSDPVSMMRSIKKALRPRGQLYLIEYRAEDPDVPIKRLHKMSEKQAIKEMATFGFRLKENITNLPWQHCMVFVKGL